MHYYLVNPHREEVIATFLQYRAMRLVHKDITNALCMLKKEMFCIDVESFRARLNSIKERIGFAYQINMLKEKKRYQYTQALFEIEESHKSFPEGRDGKPVPDNESRPVSIEAWKRLIESQKKKNKNASTPNDTMDSVISELIIETRNEIDNPGFGKLHNRAL